MPDPALAVASVRYVIFQCLTSSISRGQWYLFPGWIYVRVLHRDESGLYVTDRFLGPASHELSEVFLSPKNLILETAFCSHSTWE